MRRAPVIVLSPEERIVLERWARSTRREDHRAVRARIVLRAARGMENLEVARSIRVNRLTVARWRTRFLVARLRGITPGAMLAPRRPKVSEDIVRAILRRSVSGPSTGGPKFTTRAIARQYGVSHTSVRRIWGAYRMRPVQFREFPLRAEPLAPLAPTEIVGVFLHPPEFAVATLLTPSELRAGAARGAIQSVPGLETIEPSRARAASELALTLSDLADPARCPGGEYRGEREFLRFLSAIDDAIGHRADVRVVATDPGRARASTLGRWRVRHPNFRIDLLPDPSSWRRRASIEIETVARSLGSPGAREGRLATSRSLSQALATYSAGGVPFEWIATRREIRLGRAAPRLRHELASTGHPS